MILSIWTDELVAKLAKMWAEGYSCELIAQELGCTRNAVIGKAHRLKLEGRVATKVAVRREPKPKQIRQQKQFVRASHNALSMRIARIEFAEHKLRSVEIKCETTFEDMTGCRWPDAGDGPFLFCNGERMKGKSYCVGHFHLSREVPRVYARAA